MSLPKLIETAENRKLPEAERCIAILDIGDLHQKEAAAYLYGKILDLNDSEVLGP